MKRYAFFFTCMFCIVVCIRAGQQPGSRQVSRDAKKPVGTSPRSDRLHLYDVASLLSYVQQLQPDTALQGSSVQQLLPSEAVAGILEKGDSILLMLGNALDTAETSGDTVLQSALYRLMAEVYKLQHNYIASVAAWEKHDRLARLIAEKSRLRDIALIRTTEKRKHDFTSMYIIAIALVIVVIILAVSFRRTTVLNRKLQEAIGIRDKLFSVIGHDLRGPTGNLVQGLELVGTKTLSKATEDTILNGLLRQARNLSDTLLTLLTWARTQLKGIKINRSASIPKKPSSGQKIYWRAIGIRKI